MPLPSLEVPTHTHHVLLRAIRASGRVGVAGGGDHEAGWSHAGSNPSVFRSVLGQFRTPPLGVPLARLWPAAEARAEPPRPAPAANGAAGPAMPLPLFPLIRSMQICPRTLIVRVAQCSRIGGFVVSLLHVWRSA